MQPEVPKEESKVPDATTQPVIQPQPVEPKEEKQEYEFDDPEIKDNIIKIFEIFEEKAQTLAATKDIQIDIKEPLPNERKMKFEKLPTLLRALDQVPSQEDLEQYKKEFSKQETVNKVSIDVVTLHEVFLIMMRRLKKTDTVEELKNALKLFAVDEEQDKIPNEQFRNALATMGLKFDPETIEKIIKEADTDNDGYVEIDCFASILMGEKKKKKKGGKKKKTKAKAK
jgi:Ca2+-binding EF-hand superfamily protein